MSAHEIFQAIILGIIEGITEFLPVSSTAHLIIAHDLLQFKEDPGFVFEIVIQLGAILAVCYKFWRRITVVGMTLGSKHESRKFVGILLAGFLPAMVIGAVAIGFIKQHLFNLTVIGIALTVGGILIIIIENYSKRIKYETVDDIDYKTAFKIGFYQCLGMIPGTSRSGATIMGALMSGVSRQAAAEYSFFLAIPTMFAATVYDLYKNRHDLHADSIGLISVGFIAAFFSALVVVNVAIDFISKHGFKPFAYYRIVVGVTLLILTFPILAVPAICEGPDPGQKVDKKGCAVQPNSIWDLITAPRN